MTTLAVILASLAALAAFASARAVVRVRGKRLVTCPETGGSAAVEVDLRYAAFGGAFGRPLQRLGACSRWPERGRCGMPCLDQIEAAPEEGLVADVLTRWYRGGRCAFCGGGFEDVRWHDEKPALLAADGALVAWEDLRPEAVPAALGDHRPVCWNCLVVQTLRRERPDLFARSGPRAAT